MNLNSKSNEYRFGYVTKRAWRKLFAFLWHSFNLPPALLLSLVCSYYQQFIAKIEHFMISCHANFSALPLNLRATSKHCVHCCCAFEFRMNTMEKVPRNMSASLEQKLPIIMSCNCCVLEAHKKMQCTQLCVQNDEKKTCYERHKRSQTKFQWWKRCWRRKLKMDRIKKENE